MRIGFDNATGVSEVGFPALVVLDRTVPALDTLAADFADARFVDDDNATQLAMELEAIEGTRAIFWVRVPTLSAGTADFIWLYFENAAATAAGFGPRESVWDADFVAVWHLGARADSTANHNDALAGLAVARPARVGFGMSFADANDQPLVVPPSDSIAAATTSLTLSCWAFRETDQSNWRGFITRQLGNEGGDHFHFGTFNGEHNSHMQTSTAGTQIHLGPAPTASWFHQAMTWDGSTHRLFVNGQLITSESYAQPLETDTINEVLLGGDVNGDTVSPGDDRLDGILDECRMSRAQRSDAWVALEYASMNGALASLGVRERF